MEITLRTAVNAQEALTQLANQRLPVKTAYRLTKIIRVLDTELKDYFQARNKIIESHGKQQKDGSYRIPEEDTQAMTKAEAENKELLDEVIKLDTDPLSIDMLGDVTMSVMELEQLAFLFSG